MDVEEMKKWSGIRAAEQVEDGMVLGLGTGSTVKYAIIEIGRRCREGDDILGIPTSESTRLLAEKVGIPLTRLEEHPSIDLVIDGADEVTPDFQLIKGLGGALTREKIIAYASSSMTVVVDETKLVEKLGERSPLPVEVVAEYECYLKELLEEKTGGKGKIRKENGKTFFTDNGNPIIDMTFQTIHDPIYLERVLNMIPGVLENGLFLNMADRVVIGTPDGTRVRKKS